jgi:ParB family transcriptional regulator, chromosome partitioning protein
MVVPLQKGRLGRGLASLIGETPSVEQRLPVHGEQRLLPISELHPSGRNPRKAFDEAELADLANSIRSKGLVQPIIARPDRDRGGYEIVAGERRWRAAQRASLHNVTVIVRELSDQEVAEFALIENVQRSDLNAIEEAAGYQELIEKFGYTQEKLADAIGKSRSHLANMLRLLKLPVRVQAFIKEGKLAPGAARAIVGHDHVDVLAEEIIARGLTVREVEALVADMQQNPGSTVAKGGGSVTQVREPRDKDADTKAFEKEFSDLLGLGVEVQRGSGESGYLSIKYSNYEQLDYIRSRLLGTHTY